MNEVIRYQAPDLAELQAIEQQANVLAKTQFIPAAYRGKPGDIIAAALIGRELGWAPIVSLQRIIVVDGKPTVDAQGMVGLIRDRGHNLTRIDLQDRDGNYYGTKAVGKHRGTGDEMEFTFTLDDAKQAGLYPGNERSAWRKYPRAMCWARAVSQLGRMLFADVLLGVSYTPEEMGSVSGAEVIVEASPPAPHPKAPEQPQALPAPDPVVPVPNEPTPEPESSPAPMVDAPTPEVLDGYRSRIVALPREQQDEVKRWLKANGVVWKAMTKDQLDGLAAMIESLESVVVEA